MPAPTIERVEFFFDPGCPWTWKTASWLLDTSADVHWRSFPLEFLSKGPLPAKWADEASASAVASRLVESLASQGRNPDIARFYLALGGQIHERLVPPSVGLVRSIGLAVGLSADDLQALDDVTLDTAVRTSFDDAQSLTGPELGSPVLAVTFTDGRRRGVFGPIVTGTVSNDTAEQLWAATITLLGIDQFAEVKRGRGLPYQELDPSLRPHVA